jgi:hypothetical protein
MIQGDIEAAAGAGIEETMQAGGFQKAKAEVRGGKAEAKNTTRAEISALFCARVPRGNYPR